MTYECNHDPEHLVHIHIADEEVAPSEGVGDEELRYDCDPECMPDDEPSGSLDGVGRKTVVQTVRELNAAIDDAIEDARRRADERQAARQPIDYVAANKAFRRHKAALTRAQNSGDPQQVVKTVVQTVREWNASAYPWPDSWSRWQVALDDALPWNERVNLEDIR